MEELEELRDLAPSNPIEIIETVREGLDIVDTDYHRLHPEAIDRELMRAIEEIMKEINQDLKTTVNNLSEDKKAKFNRLFRRYLASLEKRSPLTYQVIAPFLITYLLPDESQNNELKNLRYPIKTFNQILNIAESKRFIAACGLAIDMIRGSHAKLYDPENQMQGTIPLVISGRKTHRLENIIKQFIDQELPIERIINALNQLNYRYTDNR